MKKHIPPEFRDALLAQAGGAVLPAIRWCPVAVPKDLMPYEAAAKTIFIRANGGPAYYKATGIVRNDD